MPSASVAGPVNGPPTPPETTRSPASKPVTALLKASVKGTGLALVAVPVGRMLRVGAGALKVTAALAARLGLPVVASWAAPAGTLTVTVPFAAPGATLNE